MYNIHIYIYTIIYKFQNYLNLEQILKEISLNSRTRNSETNSNPSHTYKTKLLQK